MPNNEVVKGTSSLRKALRYVVESRPIAYGILALWFGFWVWVFYQTLEFYFG